MNILRKCTFLLLRNTMQIISRGGVRSLSEIIITASERAKNESHQQHFKPQASHTQRNNRSSPQSTHKLTSDTNTQTAANQPSLWGEVHRKEGTKQKQKRRQSGNSAHITASASCACKATHIRKVRNSNIVQVSGEATATGRAPQKTGNRAAVVLHQPPGGEREQERSQTPQSKRPLRETAAS